MQTHLEEIIQALPKENRGHIHAKEGGGIPEQLMTTAKENDIDLIVMGLRKKYSLIDRFFGTISARMVNILEIPIMVIPYGARYAEIKDILFPTAMTSNNTLL
ncbi:MAG: universal stress protein [Bacteroidia bacterium]|nr:universal stress protein [Bacteroidia bacterium]